MEHLPGSLQHEAFDWEYLILPQLSMPVLCPAVTSSFTDCRATHENLFPPPAYNLSGLSIPLTTHHHSHQRHPSTLNHIITTNPPSPPSSTFLHLPLHLNGQLFLPHHLRPHQDLLQHSPLPLQHPLLRHHRRHNLPLRLALCHGLYSRNYSSRSPTRFRFYRVA